MMRTTQKGKLSLGRLQVKSFITQLNQENLQTLKGGGGTYPPPPIETQ